MRHPDARQLSLFDALAAPPSAASPAPAAPAAPGDGRAPPTPRPPARRAPAPPPAPASPLPEPPSPTAPPPLTTPAAPPAVLPAGCSWHELAVGGRALGYILRRSRRRSIGLVIRDSGLMIQAPAWASGHQIEAAIRQKFTWITAKLQAQRQRMEQLALQSAQWRPGGRIPYLGAAITLRLDGAGSLRFSGDPAVPTDGDTLILPLPQAADADRIQERAQAWLQARAREDLGRRLAHFLALSGQTIRGWGLSGAQARWGSCSSQRRIRLNWRLVHFEPALIDYVVAHEVAHLKEMNHSPAFWREVERLYPGFQPARERLRQHRPGTLPLF